MSDHTKEHEHGYANGSGVTRQVTPGGHQIDTSQPAFPIYHRKFANPAPLGLLAFACTTYVLSLINIGARGVTSDYPIVGLVIAFGGTAQFLAGMWEFAAGNTFGACAFSGYGAFWWSFGLTVLIPAAIPGAAVDEEMFENYLGIYLSSWFIFTSIMLIASLRSSVALVGVFFFLDITFLLLFIAFFSGNSMVKTAGAFGIITAAVVSQIHPQNAWKWFFRKRATLSPDKKAFYTGAAGLMDGESAFRLPVVSLARSD